MELEEFWKIENGEYIRTKEGLIGTFETYADNYYINYKNISGWHEQFVDEKDIVKHSKNIIDLIEEGDVIQLKNTGEKYEVLKISWSKQKGNHIHIINPLKMQGGKDIFIENIKSIVTKEQFKEMEYRINE